MKPRRLSPAGAVVIGTAITALVSIWFWYISQRWTNVIFVMCPGIALIVMLTLGSDRIIERLQLWIDAHPRRIAIAPAGLWLLYIVYAAGMNIADMRGLAVMAIYLAVPFVMFSRRLYAKTRMWLEPAAILWIWLPMEFGLIRRTLITTQGSDLHYAFAQLLAIDAGIIAFAVWNGTPGIGYRFEWDVAIFRSAFMNFMMFAAIAIPLGIEIGFIRFGFSSAKLPPAPATFVGIFLFTALPEEFLFRGLIQNWIERTTKMRVVSLVIAAIIFGASHLNNGPPIPNYRYFLMASIAGIFYGRAWQNTGSLMSSSITHALVDTCWSVFFR